MKTQRYWTTDQACQALGVSPPTLRKMVDAGEIPAILIRRQVRFCPDQVHQSLCERAADRQKEILDNQGRK